MKYFDNAATSFTKPAAVWQAMEVAVKTMGNPGRGVYDASLNAARAINAARQKMALLTGGKGRDVAFTSGVTESLNLLINELIGPQDAVITTVLEHNSVLRPLYKSGCELSFLGCDDHGALLYDDLPSMLKPNTRFVVCTLGSNVIGSVTNIEQVRDFCRANGLILIVDAAQTLGCLPVGADMADFICFTGHKGLYGPPGTGGILSANFDALAQKLPRRPFKTGGTGSDSFSAAQPFRMPDAFEAGTPNTPGICGLDTGISFVLDTGPDTIRLHEEKLTAQFLAGVQEIPRVIVYGSPSPGNHLPVVSINLKDTDAEDVSLLLWEEYQIATRPGSHCAPLVHKRFKTEQRGMVRFSFSWYTTAGEIDASIAALADIAAR